MIHKKCDVATLETSQDTTMDMDDDDDDDDDDDTISYSSSK